MIAVYFILGIVALIAGYLFYGRFLVRQFNIDEERATPAHTMRDGVDFLPTRRPVLFGHHFSSIAGAAPIVGPIFAATLFGWGPTLIWILIGSIFIGGLHDFSSLVMSVRHRARSIAEICRLYLSPLTYRFLLLFIWLALGYVLIVFLDLTASTFVSAPAADPNQGATVASASIFYIFLAAVFGLAMNRFGLSLRLGTIIFVPLVFLGLLGSHFIPLTSDLLPTWFFDSPRYTWSLILIVYCFVASVLPVSALLQPRDYLSSFLLFACLGLGGLGLILSGATGQLPIQLEAFSGWEHPTAGLLFPTLFITVACGSVSGFHSIVSSGTTAKQLPGESAARPIAYGGMLTEAALALIALATVMCMAGVDLSQTPPTAVFAGGIGRFLGIFGLPTQYGAAFGLLAVSTFLLTTLDTTTRLARYIIEEFFNLKSNRWRYISTAVTLLPLGMAFVAFPKFNTEGLPIVNAVGETVMQPAWRVIWPAFGTTNQLLAALALLVVVVWRRSQGRAIWFIVPPMLFMLVTTCVSMAKLIDIYLFAEDSPHSGPDQFIGWVSVVMSVMVVLLVADTVRSWGRLGRQASADQPQAKAEAIG